MVKDSVYLWTIWDSKRVNAKALWFYQKYLLSFQLDQISNSWKIIWHSISIFPQPNTAFLTMYASFPKWRIFFIDLCRKERTSIHLFSKLQTIFQNQFDQFRSRIFAVVKTKWREWNKIVVALHFIYTAVKQTHKDRVRM